MKALFIVPGLFGPGGSVTNERELAKSLSKKVRYLYVITFLSVNKYFRYRKDAKDLRKLLNGTLLILPNFTTPPINNLFVITNLFFTYINSAVSMLLALVLRKLDLVNAIYIRDPRMAIAFFSPKKVANVSSIKFAGFYTQDMVRPKSPIGDFFTSLLERINYIVVNNADSLIVQDNLFKPALQKFYNLSAEKSLVVIPAGVNIEEISKNSVNGNGKVCKYKIGYVGSAARLAGLDILIESMYIVNRVFPNAVLHAVIGGGDPAIIRQLKARAKQLELNAVFSGPVSHEKALELMSGLYALVVPRSRYLSAELTIPIKVIEAFALGVPVVITKHRVLEEKYTDGEGVIYVEPEAKDVAEKIIMLLANPSLAQKLSEQGLFNSKEFDYDILASRLADTLFGLYTKKRIEFGYNESKARPLVSYDFGYQDRQHSY